MSLAEQRLDPSTVPWAVRHPTRVPKQRYYDPEFFALEAELLWPRVWQMACRLDEIPEPGDFVEYEILDQSIIVVRTHDRDVKAFHNACRHRAVKLVDGSGSCQGGFVCPFHGWCFDLNGANTFVLQPEMFAEGDLRTDDLVLTAVRLELWNNCAWINLDNDAPPLRQCIEPFATDMEHWRAEDLRVEWWLSCRLPTNWKIAMAAFMEGWHTTETHPQFTPKASMRAGPFDPRQLVELNLHLMRTISNGMAGMTHEIDVRTAEGLRGMELPADPVLAQSTWRRTLNDAVMQWWKANGVELPDLNELDRLGYGQHTPVYFCFPHTFLLPTYSAASAYRFRPTGPEETIMEIWSLRRYPPGEQPPRPVSPVPMAPDDPRWPPIPKQDFSNLPRQQKGLHSRGFEFMRLAAKNEGMISNFERVVDGFLAGVPTEKLVPAIHTVNRSIDAPVADLRSAVRV